MEPDKPRRMSRQAPRREDKRAHCLTLRLGEGRFPFRALRHFMSKLEISRYPDTAAARAELTAFLEQHDRVHDAAQWAEHMRFWWEQNPAASMNDERGRWVHADKTVVGFGGTIPALHAWQGSPVPTLYATTLCANMEFPRAAALVFLVQRELTRKHMIVHTTPNPRVQEALLKMGARAEKSVTRHFFSAGAFAWLKGRHWWPTLPQSHAVVRDLDKIQAVKRPYRRADRVEKWITPEYLRWFCHAPGRKHHFLGLVDSAGILSSCLLVTPRRVRGLRCWDVLEAFTSADDDAELHALTGLLIREPGILPGSAALVTTNSFPNDHVWNDTPALLRRAQEVCHFTLMPEPLRDAPKHSVMAEGDFGL